MRIGIYGGSFNPIHKGHTELAASIVQQGLVDELWLLVSPLNPLKSGGVSDIAEYEHRLQMALLATEGIDGVKVSDFERHLPLPSYTITTLGELRKAYPEHEFVLVIGADNWEQFPHWYHAQEIIDTYSILIYRRPGVHQETSIISLELPPHLHLQVLPMTCINHLQLTSNHIAVEILRHAQFGIDEE